jgi:hypothetical protein
MKKTLFGWTVLTVLAVTATATAAERTSWYGKDDEGYRYAFTHNGGKSWTESIGGQLRGRCTEVDRTDDYIELQLNGEPSERTRLYGDKFYMWSEKRGKWIYMGQGKWAN